MCFSYCTSNFFWIVEIAQRQHNRGNYTTPNNLSKKNNVVFKAQQNMSCFATYACTESMQRMYTAVGAVRLLSNHSKKIK